MDDWHRKMRVVIKSEVTTIKLICLYRFDMKKVTLEKGQCLILVFRQSSPSFTARETRKRSVRLRKRRETVKV